MQKLSNPWVAVVAISVVGFLEWQALVHGVDGGLFAATTALIAGIAGFSVQSKKGG